LETSDIGSKYSSYHLYLRQEDLWLGYVYVGMNLKLRRTSACLFLPILIVLS